MKIKNLILAFTVIKICSANEYKTLKDYVGDSGFNVGVAVSSDYFNDNKYVNATLHFNTIVAENGCKLSAIQPNEGKFDFSSCDEHLKFAQEHNMEFRGHCLLWHSYQPKWFESITDAAIMKQTIINHITEVLTYYKGKIKAWDVVNEAIDDDSPENSFAFRNSFLYQALPDFVDVAFNTARRVDPDVKLFYNDYSTEGRWPKTFAVYNFIKDLIERNIPIDGVGIQYHTSVKNQPSYYQINNIISKYCELGIEVHITEMDVECDNKCNDSDINDIQGNVFANALKACLNNTCCTSFLVWGIADKNSWLGKDKKPLLFDNNYIPKAQYTALLNVLKDTLGETIVTENKTDISTDSGAISILPSTFYHINFFVLFHLLIIYAYYVFF